MVGTLVSRASRLAAVRGSGCALVMVGAALLGACSSLAPVPGAAPIEPPRSTDADSWQRVRFFIHWPEGDDPHWYVGTLVAHRVVGPALARHRSEIVLWRFHRRANRDPAGHSLSFLSYSPPGVNAQLCTELRSDPLVQRLLQARLLDKIACSGPPPATAGRIDATSDSSWPPEIQRAWPYFIMGVSETWLRLIDEYARETGAADPADLQQTLQRYREVQDRISAVWTERGGHAFIHHLSGVFAYEPLYVNERRLQGF